MARFQRVTASLTAFAMLFSSVGLPVHAEIIDTDAAIQSESQDQKVVAAAKETIARTLDRSDLQLALAEKGVSVSDIQTRLNAMTDDEIVQLSRDIESAPAGAGDIIGAMVFIFVLLLVTDILGLTKVFPFTRSLRR